MQTTGSRTYLLNLLAAAETSLSTVGFSQEREFLGQLRLRIAGVEDLNELLESLYCVEGMEKVALKLMWVSSRAFTSANGSKEELLRYHTELVRSAVARKEERHPNFNGTAEYSTESLADALLRFHLFIARLRHKHTTGGPCKPIDHESMEHFLAATDHLQNVSARSGNRDVFLFCECMKEFVRFVCVNGLEHDTRVFNVIEAANVTLQTVVGGRIAGERDSLEQTLELLKNPTSLFQHTSG